MVDLSVLGISVQEEVSTPLLLLYPHGTRQVISMQITPMEAFSISMALQGRTDGSAALPAAADTDAAAEGAGELGADFMPASGQSAFGPFSKLMPHDLMIRLMETLGGRLLTVELLHLTDGVFVADMVFKSATRIVRLDCRAPDAIALALRCGALIKLAEPLLSEAEDMDKVMDSLPEHVRTIIAAKLSSLPRPGGLAEFSRSLSLPPMVEAALAAKEKFIASSARRNIINAAQKIIEQKGLYEELDKLLESTHKEMEEQQERNNAASEIRQRTSPRVSVKIGSVTVGGSPEERSRQAGDPDGDFSVGKRDALLNLNPDKPTGDKDDLARQLSPPRIKISISRPSFVYAGSTREDRLFPPMDLPREALAGLGLSASETEALEKTSSEERWAVLLRLLLPETKALM